MMITAKRSKPKDLSQNHVLFCSPLAEDAELADALAEENFRIRFCTDWPTLCQQLTAGASIVLIAQEVLPASWASQIDEFLGQQTETTPTLIILSEASEQPASLKLPASTRVLFREALSFERPLSIVNLTNILRVIMASYLNTHHDNVRSLQTQLQRNQQQIDDLLTVLNDKLRNPVAAIAGAIELLKPIESSHPQLRIAQEILQRQVNQLAQVLDTYLDDDDSPPANSEGSDISATMVSGQNSANQTMQILVVDDNRDAARGLALLLENLGYEVSVAYDGCEALDTARLQQPRAVLLDLGLPKLDGYQVAQQLRADPRFQKALLVAITGFSRDSSRQQAKTAGFDYHLTKPVKLEVLQQLLATLAV